MFHWNNQKALAPIWYKPLAYENTAQFCICLELLLHEMALAWTPTRYFVIISMGINVEIILSARLFT